jgi:S-(hydroxymethyl)glutathione dehydrogenase/alcohol dehydrogenase
MPLERLISRRVALDEVNDAFADLSAGRGVRTVIVN